MSATQNTMLGRRGEQQACDLLVAGGQTILERNWRSGHRELDLITLDAAGVHFVEVKDRTDENFLAGSVDARKQRNMVSAARHYLASHAALREMEAFFDVVLIVDGRQPEYYPQAFIPYFV
ncbi:MAG: YraN family protein [Bacteroidales bacterium]|nr:YraN family protein [Bacteroidales bacterium]